MRTAFGGLPGGGPAGKGRTGKASGCANCARSRISSSKVSTRCAPRQTPRAELGRRPRRGVRVGHQLAVASNTDFSAALAPCFSRALR